MSLAQESKDTELPVSPPRYIEIKPSFFRTEAEVKKWCKDLEGIDATENKHNVSQSTIRQFVINNYEDEHGTFLPNSHITTIHRIWTLYKLVPCMREQWEMYDIVKILWGIQFHFDSDMHCICALSIFISHFTRTQPPWCRLLDYPTLKTWARERNRLNYSSQDFGIPLLKSMDDIECTDAGVVKKWTPDMSLFCDNYSLFRNIYRTQTASNTATPTTQDSVAFNNHDSVTDTTIVFVDEVTEEEYVSKIKKLLETQPWLVAADSSKTKEFWETQPWLVAADSLSVPKDQATEEYVSKIKKLLETQPWLVAADSSKIKELWETQSWLVAADSLSAPKNPVETQAETTTVAPSVSTSHLVSTAINQQESKPLSTSCAATPTMVTRSASMAKSTASIGTKTKEKEREKPVKAAMKQKERVTDKRKAENARNRKKYGEDKKQKSGPTIEIDVNERDNKCNAKRKPTQPAENTTSSSSRDSNNKKERIVAEDEEDIRKWRQIIDTADYHYRELQRIVAEAEKKEKQEKEDRELALLLSQEEGKDNAYWTAQFPSLDVTATYNSSSSSSSSSSTLTHPIKHNVSQTQVKNNKPDNPAAHNNHSNKDKLSATKPTETNTTPASNEGVCVICLDKRSSYVCIPCGHVCLCDSCSTKKWEKCPVCTASVKDRIKIFTC